MKPIWIIVIVFFFIISVLFLYLWRQYIFRKNLKPGDRCAIKIGDEKQQGCEIAFIDGDNIGVMDPLGYVRSHKRSEIYLPLS